MKVGCAAVIVLGALAVGVEPVSGQSAENVAVVINEASAASQRIAEHYIHQRAIPSSNVIRIRTSQQETIDRRTFVDTIQNTIAAALARHRLQDRILYIVLTKGVPLRIAGTGGLEGSSASVDSELTLLYRRMTGKNVPVRGRVDNPYFLGTREVREARLFTRRQHDIYLVTRLDAFTVEEALALVDRARAPARHGRIVLDQRNQAQSPPGDAWLALAAERLQSVGYGDAVFLENSTSPARGHPAVLGYHSWGSNDQQNRVRSFGMSFVPGSLAALFVSSDARTLSEPPPDWTPSKGPFSGSAHSLVGDLIREGATGVAGHVSEPYFQSTIRPEILFPTYLAGFNLAESFYLAMPHLSWQTVVVGDPLCGPFDRKTLTRSDIEDDIDAEMQLPAIFAGRRLSSLKQLGLSYLSGTDRSAHVWKVFEQPISQGSGIPEQALRWVLRSESHLARDEIAPATEALEQATKVHDRLTAAHLLLAALYEQAGQYDSAIQRYRRVLELQPNLIVALNNLAFILAVQKQAAADALPLAKRAAELAPSEPLVLDTLAWIEYLLGNWTGATKIITQAVKLAPSHAEIRLRAAIIHASAGATAIANSELKEALRLDPTLENREEVRNLRRRLESARRR